MAKKKAVKRNDKGDIIGEHKKFDMCKLRQSLNTYVFHYYDEQRQLYRPYFNLFHKHDEDIEKATHDPDFFERQLYWTPEHPPFDFYIHYHNWQLGLLVEFFKEVFEERAFIDGYMPQHKYFRVILPKPLYYEIMNCINDFELLQIRDLLFEVISIAQHKYIKDIAFWEKPENQELITSAKKETQKVIDILEKTDHDKWLREEMESKMPPKLSYINFVFSDGAIRINHNWLAGEFIKCFKDQYENMHYKNWRIDLARYPERFEENIHDKSFKYRLVKSLYNLFTEADFFKVTKKEPTPNKLMLCIAKLVEFCLIPVASPDELDEIKVKNIRNWLKRKELKEDLTYAEVPINEKRLRKYFSPDLLPISKQPIRVNSIWLGFFLSKRFNIEHLRDDLIHIAHFLDNRFPFRSAQVFSEGIVSAAPFPEFDAFRKLAKGVKAKKKITSIKFKMEDDNTEYELKQRLPLYLIGEAINEYSENHKVEMDTDLIKSKYTTNPDGSLSVERSKFFNLPEERFFVRFVKAFYDYLLAEAPPEDYEYMPSKMYYEIIALMLQKNWFFYQQLDPEWFITAKVQQWHNIALGK